MGDLQNGAINIAFAINNDKYTHFKSFDFHRGFFHALSKSGNFEDTLVTTDDRPETDLFQKFSVKKKIYFKSHICVEIWSLAIRFVQLSSGCCIVPDFISFGDLKVIKSVGWRANYSVSAFVRKVHELSHLEQEMMESVFCNNQV